MAHSERPDAFEADTTMRAAKSLLHFVKQVEKKGFSDPKSDILLFEGAFMALPILTAFAVELALKALLYRDGHARHKTHNLGRLYEKLDRELRDSIEKKMPTPHPRNLIKALHFDVFPDYMPVGKFLEHHATSFTNWRYLYENSGGEEQASFHQAALDRALTAIISVYEEKYGNVQ